MSATLSFPRCGDRDTLLKAAPPPQPPLLHFPFPRYSPVAPPPRPPSTEL